MPFFGSFLSLFIKKGNDRNKKSHHFTNIIFQQLSVSLLYNLPDRTPIHAFPLYKDTKHAKIFIS